MSLKQYDYSQEELTSFKYAVIKTNKGDIVLNLYPDEAPNTVSNFVYLAKGGFYDRLIFHRVISNFVIQGGCPNKNGTGGPGWQIACECDSNVHRHTKGTLSMAHAGRNTGGSQFFICHSSQPHLDGVHTVFGGIVETSKSSFDVLNSIRENDIIESIQIQEKI